MGQEPRTRFTWTWAGILAGVVLAGASYGSREPVEETREPVMQEREVHLVQLDPTPGTGTSQGTGQQPPPGVTPTPGTAQTPFVTGTDAGTGVGGSGYSPPSTAYSGGQDAGYGSPSIPIPGSGVGGSGGIPSVGGLDGGMGF